MEYLKSTETKTLLLFRDDARVRPSASPPEQCRILRRYQIKRSDEPSREEEADRFALDGLRLAYRRDMVNGLTHIGPSPANAIGQGFSTSLSPLCD